MIVIFASVSNIVYENRPGVSGNAMSPALEAIAFLQWFDDENCDLIKRSSHCYYLEAFGFGILLLQWISARGYFRHEETQVSCFAQVLGHHALKSSYINRIGVLHENLRTSKKVASGVRCSDSRESVRFKLLWWRKNAFAGRPSCRCEGSLVVLLCTTPKLHPISANNYSQEMSHTFQTNWSQIISHQPCISYSQILSHMT